MKAIGTGAGVAGDKGRRLRTAAVSAGLAGWLVVTVLGQLPDQRFDSLLRRGRWRIAVPNWRFFGPNPGVKDVHLLSRDVTREGPRPWEEVPVTPVRPWYALAWNARNRAPKALFDACQDISIVSRAYANNLDVMERNLGYRTLADYVTRHLPHASQATATQFLLMETYLVTSQERTMAPLFVSRELPLPMSPGGEAEAAAPAGASAA